MRMINTLTQEIAWLHQDTTMFQVQEWLKNPIGLNTSDTGKAIRPSLPNFFCGGGGEGGKKASQIFRLRRPFFRCGGTENR